MEKTTSEIRATRAVRIGNNIDLVRARLDGAPSTCAEWDAIIDALRGALRHAEAARATFTPTLVQQLRGELAEGERRYTVDGDGPWDLDYTLTTWRDVDAQTERAIEGLQLGDELRVDGVTVVRRVR